MEYNQTLVSREPRTLPTFLNQVPTIYFSFIVYFVSIKFLFFSVIEVIISVSEKMSDKVKNIKKKMEEKIEKMEDKEKMEKVKNLRKKMDKKEKKEKMVEKKKTNKKKEEVGIGTTSCRSNKPNSLIILKNSIYFYGKVTVYTRNIPSSKLLTYTLFSDLLQFISKSTPATVVLFSFV